MFITVYVLGLHSVNITGISFRDRIVVVTILVGINIVFFVLNQARTVTVHNNYAFICLNIIGDSEIHSGIDDNIRVPVLLANICHVVNHRDL